MNGRGGGETTLGDDAGSVVVDTDVGCGVGNVVGVGADVGLFIGVGTPVGAGLGAELAFVGVGTLIGVGLGTLGDAVVF